MPVPWMTMGRMPPTLESNFFPPGSGRLGGRSAIARHLVPGFVRYYVTYTHKCAYVYTLHCVYIYTFCIHVYLVCIRIFINAPAYAVHRFHIHCRCTYIYYIIYTTLNGMSLEAYTSNIMQSIQVKCTKMFLGLMDWNPVRMNYHPDLVQRFSQQHTSRSLLVCNSTCDLYSITHVYHLLFKNHGWC